MRNRHRRPEATLGSDPGSGVSLASSESRDPSAPSQRLRASVPFLVSALFVLGLAMIAGWPTARPSLSLDRMVPLGIGAALYAVSLALRGVRAQALLNGVAGLGVRWREAADLAAVTTFSNHTLPFRLGDLLFLFIVRSHHAVPTERVLVVLLIARAYDVLCAVLVFFAAAFTMALRHDGHWAPYLAAAGALLTLAGLRPDRLIGGIERMCVVVSRLLSVSSRDRVSSVIQWVQRFQRSTEARAGRRIVAATLVSSLAVWVILIVSYQQLLLGLGIPLALDEVGVGSVGATLVSVFPLSVVGNIGPFEAGWAVGFAVHGIAIVVSGLLAAPAFRRNAGQLYLAWREARRRRCGARERVNPRKVR